MRQLKTIQLPLVTVEFLRSYIKDFVDSHTTINGASCSICGGSKGRHRIEDCFVGIAQDFLNELED